MLEIDQVLQGRYRITRMLGRGGMGAVYEAKHIELEMVCVVKEMLPPDDPTVVEALATQFKREGKILAGLRHPNLPRVSDYFTEDGKYYLVMDLVSGQSMDKVIGQQGLPEATVLQYADQLLDVLGYVHVQCVLHRDIKPANIIVQPDGHVMLVDFGLVKVLDGQKSSFSMRGLTPHYAPPEQYTGGTDVCSDLYSLAATLYQALCAQLPTSAADQFAGKPLVTLHQLRPDISMNTVRVIEKTLLLDRTKRYQSAAEMRTALKNVAQKSAAVPDNPTISIDSQRLPDSRIQATSVPAKPRISLWAPVAVGVLAVVIMVLLVVVIVPGLTLQPAAPTAFPTRLPTRTAIQVTSLSVPKPTVTLAVMDTPVSEATNTPEPSPPAQKNDLLLTLSPGVTIEMVRIKAGEFLMGSLDSDPDASSDEKPQNRVMLAEYLIGKYDVTNTQFAAFAKATNRNWTMPSGKENHPVVDVTWDDASAFCAWASQVTGRKVMLPSEAQWEKAARGTEGGMFPWGNGEPDTSKLNYNNNVGGTTKVGKYSPAGDSQYGVADMAGTVWQWTSSLYKPYPYNPNDGREDQYSRDARVLRGGGFSYARWDVRSANRGTLRDNPDNRGGFSSFRVSVSPT